MAISSWYKQHLFQKQQRSEATSRSSSGRGFWSSLFANDEETNKAAHMLEALAELWEDVSSTKRQMDRVEPRRFINTLRAQNMLFRSHAQQDAHEFLFFLLNDIGETLDAAAKKQAVDAGLSPPPKSESFVQTLFQGKLVTTTQCLTCEHTTYREEDFLDLGLEIEEHMSLTACLKKLRSTEILRAQNKFHCERCNSLQEAKKETRLRQVPRVLILHFKRFKVLEAGPQRLQFSKLCYRIPFPTEMAIEDEADATSYFQLFAVVIHVGRGPNSGHYVTAVRCRNTWLLFDDESIRPVDADQMASLCFGQYHRDSPSSATAYILFFQRVERK